MNRITTEKDLREATKSPRCCVVFVKPDCLHCVVAETILDSLGKDYPLIGFHLIEDMELAERNNVDTFPVIHFYENGNLLGTLHGTKYIEHIKDMLNIWFWK